MKKKVCVIGGGVQYEEMFKGEGWEVVSEPRKADLIQFTGGSDVSPELYHQTLERNTHSCTNRDMVEVRHFLNALYEGTPMAGICRGGQFLNVMCGGSMIQHVEGHATGKQHSIYTGIPDLKSVVQVSSTHHQMMVAGFTGMVVAKGIGMSALHDHTEVVFYHNQRVLCYQPHPEFNGNEENREFYFTLIEKYLEI